MRDLLKVTTFLFVGFAVLTGCSSYDQHIDEGNKFVEQKLYEEATTEFNKAINKDRNNGDAYYHWAIMGREIGDYDSALVALALQYRSSQWSFSKILTMQNFTTSVA